MKTNEMGAACNTVTYRLFVGRREGRRLLVWPNLRREDNIKMDLQEVGWEAWT